MKSKVVCLTLLAALILLFAFPAAASSRSQPSCFARECCGPSAESTSANPSSD
jgi:hypothetical protein